jgi:signal transduction histidine kinase
VPGPPIEVLAPGIHAYQGDSAPVFGRSARVAATPWQVVVEFPRDLVLAPAQRFLTRVGVLAAGILATGIGAAWLASRRITRPLRHLTEAAEAIAAGRTVVAPVSGRRDEIGRLTKAFHDMAGEVASARADLEAQVAERTTALRDSLRELEAFSYTVSHDLRAPLRGMQGFAQALLEDYGAKLDATGADYARRVVEATQRMDDLIQDLLSYSRLSREQLSIGVVDLDPVAADVVTGLAADVARRAARIEIASPLGAVRGNARILSQILQNLIGNALKFVPPEETPQVRVSSELRDGRRTTGSVSPPSTNSASSGCSSGFTAGRSIRALASGSRSCAAGRSGWAATPASRRPPARGAASGSSWRRSPSDRAPPDDPRRRGQSGRRTPAPARLPQGQPPEPRPRRGGRAGGHRLPVGRLAVPRSGRVSPACPRPAGPQAAQALGP